MALDLTGLRTEFWARGFSYLNDGGAGQTRTDRWLNDAMHAIDELADWPYLLATTTSTAPVTISDLRSVESVTDTSNFRQLVPRDRRDLRETYADLTQTGIPLFYYFTSSTTLNVYPANTSLTLTVDYWKFGPDLSSGTDAPLMPDRFRYIIVDYAVAQAMRDTGDEASAQAAQASGDNRLQLMRNSLMTPTHQGPWQVLPPIGDDL